MQNISPERPNQVPTMEQMIRTPERVLCLSRTEYYFSFFCKPTKTFPSRRSCEVRFLRDLRGFLVLSLDAPSHENPIAPSRRRSGFSEEDIYEARLLSQSDKHGGSALLDRLASQQRVMATTSCNHTESFRLPY
jgi:hypothetical protein